MIFKPFLIAPIETGLELDKDSWLIPNEAFPELTDAFLYQGKLYKKYGAQLLGRLANNTPVMGLASRELTTLNRENLIAFDTTTAYEWNGAAFANISVDTAAAPIAWTGSDINFFWCCNYYRDSTYNKLFWATNNVQNSVSGGGVSQDGIRIYNGTGWALQTPILNSVTAPTRFLNGCLILIPYRDRMVALNTLESTAATGATAVRYPNRARWSQNGVPYTNSTAISGTITGADNTAWLDTTPGKGGYVDAPTAEQIVSCGFYKDTLVVFFERSTWQLVYSGNEVLPFYWQRINSEFGCESTFSSVSFDKGIFAVGEKAIIVSDSVSVERIDQKIPIEVFNFHNLNDGKYRIHGIRDYYYEFVYWTVPDKNQNTTYPNRLLVLNYKEGSYSYYNDSYTCLGYFQRRVDDTWLTKPGNWLTASGNWLSSKEQADFPSVVGGNQQGFVMILDQNTLNDTSLYITAATQAGNCQITSPNHNLQVDQYVRITDMAVGGMVEINGLVGKITAIVNANNFTVDIDSTGFAAYTTGGLITVINTINVLSKQFNPFINEGKQARINYLDTFVSNTEGEYSLSLYINGDITIPVNTQVVPTTKNYGPTVAPDKLWQRNYLDTQGQLLQFNIYFSDSQIRTSGKTLATAIQKDLTIHAFNLWMAPSGRLESYDII